MNFIQRLNFIFEQAIHSYLPFLPIRLTSIQGYFDVTDEPSQQIPFMYHYADQPGLSTQKTRQIITKFFNTSKNGLPGNDGELSFMVNFNFNALRSAIDSGKLALEFISSVLN